MWTAPEPASAPEIPAPGLLTDPEFVLRMLPDPSAGRKPGVKFSPTGATVLIKLKRLKKKKTSLY